MYYGEVGEMGEKMEKEEDKRCVMSGDDGEYIKKKECDIS